MDVQIANTAQSLQKRLVDFEDCYCGYADTYDVALDALEADFESAHCFEQQPNYLESHLARSFRHFVNFLPITSLEQLLTSLFETYS